MLYESYLSNLTFQNALDQDVLLVVRMVDLHDNGTQQLALPSDLRLFCSPVFLQEKRKSKHTETKAACRVSSSYSSALS